jgi:hypothetical protein
VPFPEKARGNEAFPRHDWIAMQAFICSGQQISAENVVQIVPACHALVSASFGSPIRGALTVQKLLSNGRVPVQ